MYYKYIGMLVLPNMLILIFKIPLQQVYYDCSHTTALLLPHMYLVLTNIIVFTGSTYIRTWPRFCLRGREAFAFFWKKKYLTPLWLHRFVWACTHIHCLYAPFSLNIFYFLFLTIFLKNTGWHLLSIVNEVLSYASTHSAKEFNHAHREVLHMVKKGCSTIV